MVASLVIVCLLIPSFGIASVADEIQVALQESEYADYEIRSYTTSDTVWFGDFPYLVAIASKNEKNILCVFLKIDNHWIFHYAGENALYDGVDIPVISNDEYTPTISLRYLNRSPKETVNFFPKATVTERIRFFISEYEVTQTVDGAEQSLIIRRDDEKGVWIAQQANQYSEYTGDILIELQAFNIASFPKSISDAKRMWKQGLSETTYESTKQTTIDVVQSLDGSTMNFLPNKEYKVFSGPGENYLRGANGKAKVSTNGPIQVYWREKDWIFISYDVSNGGLRYGYIPASALGTPEKSLDYEEVSKTIGIGKTIQDIDILDDPNNRTAVLRTLPKESPIDILAVYSDWAYIDDTMSNETPCRGFIPIAAIEFTANF